MRGEQLRFCSFLKKRTKRLLLSGVGFKHPGLGRKQPRPGWGRGNAQAFGAKATHQPVGTMTPETTLQAFGATKLTQPLHCCPLFGVF